MIISYLQVENALKTYGEIVLFENISFAVNEGQKVAIVARNGTGKTTLLNILTGRDTFDSGTYYLNKDIKTSYLEQDPQFNPQMTLFQAVYGSPGKIMETVRKYEQALHEHDKKLLEKAVSMMDYHQAWDLDSKIRQILGVFRLNDENQLVGTLSGGQVKRLALAIALINEPDFLILDEPTNHLDVEMIEWLEEYLTKSQITLLMVTHDRYFLDHICTDIIEIDDRSLYSYKGNYSEFLGKREERLQNNARNTEKAQNLLRTELEWMRRMPKARGTKAKYRIDAFYDLKRKSEYRHNDRQVELETLTTRLGNKILVMNQVTKSFDNVVILNDFSYTFTKGEKIGIIGPNGVGKTTFLNIITGQLQPDSGMLEHGETVIYGYYRQQGMEFKSGQRVIDIIQEIAEVIETGNGRQLSVPQFLNRFLFTPEMQYTQVEKLSGGEKRRLYLMTVLMRNPNFLILDEPTNDFDIVTLNLLEEFLTGFHGCIIIVSHDRFFMDKVVDHLFIFEGNGEIYDFPGNYSDFRASQRQLEMDSRRTESKNRSETRASLPREESSAVKKKLTYKEKLEFESLSKEIEALEQEKTDLETILNAGTLKPEELFAKSNRMAEILGLIDQKTDRWLILSELNG
jgi:ABC transport system ATP-binding/permease protein